MSHQAKKVLNSEEQGRTVNPLDSDNISPKKDQPDAPEQGVVNDSPAEYEKPEAAHESETPHRVEGDDAGNIDRTPPAL